MSGILRVVKGDKGTAGTMVAPAGKFKPRTSPKVRFGFAMNIYTKPAAPATESATNSTAPQAQSWRDTLPIHPAALLLPRMSCDELQELGRDIRKNGLRFSIALWQPDKGASALLLDGISRLDAVEVELGRPVQVVPRTYRSRTWWSLEIDEDGESVPVTDLIGEAGNTTADQQTFILFGRDVDPWAYVISANLHRRHLTAEQKRELIAKLIDADPSKSDRQIAATVKVDHKTVASVRAEKEGRGEIPHVETRTDTKGRQQPAHRTTSAPSEAKSHKIKFTPERIAQIKNLIERGRSREEIAEIIGVTVGSLQVTCSRLGISLRPPRLAMTTRERLPDRRAAETFDLVAGGLKYVCTVGRFADGRIGELFLGNHKSNSAADSSARDAAITFSIAVQHGADPETIRSALCRDSHGCANGPLAAALDLIMEE